MTRNQPTRPRRSAFTLVELLVVIGIIAVLISLLLPATRKAMRQSRGVQCTSNLRQLVMAAGMYADANKGFFPPAHHLDPRATPPNSVSGALVLLREHYHDTTLVQCPEQPEATNVREVYKALYPISDELPEWASYSYNFFVFVNNLTNPTGRPTKRETLRSPSDLILIYDAAVCLGRGGPWEIIQARHSGPAFNAAFLDNHVEAIGARPAGLTGGYAGPVPNYRVDVGPRPIYYAGAEDIPYRAKSQGMPMPGHGPIVWGQVSWR